MAAGEVRLPATDWILIVDDEFDIISIFKQTLNKKGFHVFGFTDPLLALEHFHINAKRYGLVISDLRMPGMNGYEFVKKVNEIKPEIKIFLMTAFEINQIEFKRAKEKHTIPLSFFNELSYMVSILAILQKTQDQI